MSGYRLLVTLQIHSSFSALSTSDVLMERVYDLPFTPWPGLRIADERSEVEVESLWWDADGREFHGWVEDKEHYNVNAFPREAQDEAMARLANAYWDMGWRFRKVAPRVASSGQDTPAAGEMSDTPDREET